MGRSRLTLARGRVGRLGTAGAASSATVASPSASRVKIARRVGSASAPNTRLSRSVSIYNHLVLKLDGYRLVDAGPCCQPTKRMEAADGS
jgi:hypothetical protein